MFPKRLKISTFWCPLSLFGLNLVPLDEKNSFFEACLQLFTPCCNKRQRVSSFFVLEKRDVLLVSELETGRSLLVLFDLFQEVSSKSNFAKQCKFVPRKRFGG